MTTQATDILRAPIWEDGDVIEMARFTVDGVNAVKADLTDPITRKVFNKSTGDTLISSTELLVDNVVFDTLQTDARWDRDNTGYNFRDRVAGSNFATGGDTYRVEYKFLGASSEQFWIVFEHPVQAILSS